MTPTVEWQVAGACNYRCTYCIQSPAQRRGRPEAEALDAAVDWFAGLPGPWELKCSGGEAFAHPLFLAQVVPALMARTPHTLSVLTNFSATDDELDHFLALVGPRLRVVSASLHLEHAAVDTFVARARRFVDRLPADASFVVNQVVLPGREAEALACRDRVRAAGLRWFPQLYKVKRKALGEAVPPGAEPFRVADYPDEAALRAVIGDAPGPREANVAPSWYGRRCAAGWRYLVVDKDGEAWSCRSARRHHRGHLGNVFLGTARLTEGPAPCPYTLCPCTVPANRGMIEGVG